MTKEILSLLIPIIAIVMGCSIPLLAILVDYRKRRQIFALHHAERMAAIEKGIELPPLPEEFFKEPVDKAGKPPSAHSDFGWGLFWSLGGVALLAALYFDGRGASALYALIPVAIGLHYLIYYYVIGKKEAAALEAESKANAGQLSEDPLR
jgi:hypothetical protein